MKKILLYTTSGCHLCELAEGMLNEAEADWQPVEISDDDGLVEKYGIRIPVILKITNSILDENPDDELGWPFTLSELKEWL